MTYGEYLHCAEKHLKGCTSLLLSYKPNPTYDKHVWLELYYLSGYIIEGIVVYSAYKLNNWRQNDDIQRKYNLAFSQRTNLDFYYVRSHIQHGTEIIPSFFQNRPSGALSAGPAGTCRRGSRQDNSGCPPDGPEALSEAVP